MHILDPEAAIGIVAGSAFTSFGLLIPVTQGFPGYLFAADVMGCKPSGSLSGFHSGQDALQTISTPL